MNIKKQEMLRELNLYPLWRLRVAPVLAHSSLGEGVADPQHSAMSIAALNPTVMAMMPPLNDEICHAVSPTCSARSDRQVGTARRAQSMLCEFPVSPPTLPQREREQTNRCASFTVTSASWDELKVVVKNCTLCKLRVGCSQTIFGIGDEKADWLFVGEGPGADEDAQGEPFVGQAGKLLDNMLAAMKLKRSVNVYITNVVKCRPPDNRIPHADEIAQCLPYLARQIELIQPKLIVALGKTAATTLLGCDDTLINLRGKVHHYQGIPLVVTYHPAYLLHAQQEKAQAWQDLCLALTTIKK